MAVGRARKGLGGRRRRVWGVCSSVLMASVTLGVGVPPAWALPDGRVYERVSPADKNGGDVLQMTRRTRAARSGGMVGFASLVGFAAVPGMGYSADYMAVRSPSGWVTHGITPRQEPQSVTLSIGGPGDRLYEGEYSEDFTKGIARVNEFPGVPGNVATTQNLLVRQDLLAPGLGRYVLASDSTVPITPLEGNRYRPFLAGASTDFGHVIFQTHLNLTTDTRNNLQKLYESDHGTLRLVGVLLDDSIAPSAVAGSSASGVSPGYVERAISDDGSRIFFTIQDSPGAFFNSGSPTGQVYVRESASTTVHINVSEKTTPDPQASAQYWTASRDGRLVYFTTSEQLVDQDTNTGVDLYRADLQTPAGRRLSLISIDNEPDDGANGNTTAVLGASDSAERVYFVVEGQQLIDGAPIPTDPVAQLIYLWDQGQLKYVGQAGRGELSSLIGDVLNPRTVRVSPDGQHLLFMTSVLEAFTQVYLYSAQANNGAGELVCASCPPDDSAPTAISRIDADASTGGANRTMHQNHPLTDDGARVFFTTTQALDPADHNTSADAYQYTAATRTIDLISTGHTKAGDAFFMDASATGDDVFFTTIEPLVPTDQDASFDLYDARVGGGITVPPVKHPCQPSTCQTPPPPPPPFHTPPTTQLQR